MLVADQFRDAEGVEVIQPGEPEKIKEVSDQFNRFQMMNFNEHTHCLRATHLKTQGVSQFTFLINSPAFNLNTNLRSVSWANSPSRTTCLPISPKECSQSQANTT